MKALLSIGLISLLTLLVLSAPTSAAVEYDDLIISIDLIGDVDPPTLIILPDIDQANLALYENYDLPRPATQTEPQVASKFDLAVLTPNRLLLTGGGVPNARIKS